MSQNSLIYHFHVLSTLYVLNKVIASRFTPWNQTYCNMAQQYQSAEYVSFLPDLSCTVVNYANQCATASFLSSLLILLPSGFILYFLFPPTLSLFFLFWKIKC